MTKNIDERIIDKGFHTGHEVDFVTIQQSDYEYLKEQAERVQELKETNKKNYWIAADFKFENLQLEQQNKRYREALEEIMKIEENHEWNLYGIAYGIAERTLFEVEGED